jgi:hypothetical protein
MTKVKGGNKIPEVKTFPVTLALEEIKKNISITMKSHLLTLNVKQTHQNPCNIGISNLT